MHKHIVSCFLLIFSTANTAAVSIAASYSKQSTPVYFDDEQHNIDLITKGLQLGYQLDDWSAGLVLTDNSDRQSWLLLNNNLGATAIEQRSHELFVRHYFEVWSIGASVGVDSSTYSQDELQQLPNIKNSLVELTNNTKYANDDVFFELKLNYWIDLTTLLEDLSLTIETFGVYNSSTSIIESNQIIEAVSTSDLLSTFLLKKNFELGQQNLTSYEIDETRWQFGFATEFSYPYFWLENEWSLTAWQAVDYYSQSSGALSANRLRRGQRIQLTNLTLENSGQQQQAETIISIGFDLDWFINDNYSLTLGLTKLEDADVSSQLSLYYQF